MMTFCGLRIALGHKVQTDGTWELSRFCTVSGHTFPGLFSKMLKVFTQSHAPKEVITYGDGRWTHPTDNVYVKAGFSYVGTSKPSYCYCIRGEKRLHRFGFRKSILIKKYPDMAHMTETQITRKLGYRRIWDCGHHKFQLKLV